MSKTSPDVATLVHAITSRLGVRRAVDPAPLRALFEQKRYVDMFEMIKHALHLPMPLRVAIVDITERRAITRGYTFHPICRHMAHPSLKH